MSWFSFFMDSFSTVMLMISKCTYAVDKPCVSQIRYPQVWRNESRSFQLNSSKTELLSLYITIDQTQNPIIHIPFAECDSKLVTDPGRRTSFSEPHSKISHKRTLSQTGASLWTTNYHCSSPLLRFLAGVSWHSRLPVIFWIHHHLTCTTCLLLLGR